MTWNPRINVYSYTVPGHTARANVLTFSISPYLKAVVDGDVRYLTFTERMLAFLRGCGPLSGYLSVQFEIRSELLLEFKDFNAYNVE